VCSIEVKTFPKTFLLKALFEFLFLSVMAMTSYGILASIRYLVPVPRKTVWLGNGFSFWIFFFLVLVMSK
jgi:hypothetical protein